MRIPLYIPYLNRPDLLDKAIRSTWRSGCEVIVINNSGAPIDCMTATMVDEPIVPMTFSQSQNYMLKKSLGHDYCRGITVRVDHPFYLWMHSDAETTPEDLAKLIDMARTQPGNWGVIYTLYDTLCAYNTEAMQAVGGYDTDFRDYFSDNDVYRRLKLAGYELLESHIQTKHAGSQTLNSDPALKFKHHHFFFPQARELYKMKWGGEPGREKFLKPYNGMI